jgi:hypothetical protein
MPPRTLSVAIVLFWVGMTGWLTYREIWPNLSPDQPPPFTIDLADEAQNQMPVRWSVSLNGKNHGYLRTWVLFREREDTFELHGEFKLWNSEIKQGQPDFVIRSMYDVTREGALRGLEATLSYNNRLTDPVEEVEIMKLTGEVRDQKLYPHVRVNVLSIIKMDRDLDPVPLSRRASLISSHQPLNRIASLRKGQHWRIPIANLQTSVLPSAKIQYLNAEVLQETRGLKWGTNRNEVPCLIIEFEGEDISGQTWVQESDGLIVCQELQVQGVTLKLLRD